MSAFALTLVLAASVLHASWNAMVKSASDRALILGAVSLVHASAGLLIVLASPAGSWVIAPYVVASAVLHYAYYGFLFVQYRLGDLSQVYPISRGVAPALVALGAFLAAGEVLSPLGLAGLALVSFGIMVLALGRRGALADRAAVLAALANGLMIAAYSVVDGLGVRIAENPFTYIGWSYLLEFPVPLFIALRRRGAQPVEWRILRLGLLAGLCAVGAYTLVLYAKSIAPLGAVSAVRESSVIIAALIGVFLFGERPIGIRLASAAIVAAGVITLAVS